MFYPEETIAIFVDGNNLYHTARALELEIDFMRLRNHFADQARLLRATYFSLVSEQDRDTPARPLLDWMAYNGWTVATKTAQQQTADDGRKRLKGSTDLDMAVAILKAAQVIDHAVIFTGKRDFLPVIEHLKEIGTRVTIVSTTATRPSWIADDLRRAADHFIDIDDLRQAIARDKADA